MPSLSLQPIFVLPLLLALLRPAATQPPAPPKVAMPAGLPVLLRELDSCFERAELAAYRDHFLPDHAGAMAVLLQRLERLCQATPQRQRRSQVIGDARSIGPRVVVRVRSDVELGTGSLGTGELGKGEPGKKGDGPRAAFTEDWLLAMTVTADGRVRPTFAVEIPREADWPVEPRLRCPACNYEIGGVGGWMMVPVRSDRAHALEAASFYLLGTDIACDISVEYAADPVPAATLAAELGSTLQALATAPARQPAEPWLPPAHRQAPPRALDGARITVDLPDDGDGGSRSLLHVAVFGGLQHMLLLRGSRRALAQHGATVDALLASYRLLQLDAALLNAANQAIAHHCGGAVDGSNYGNTVYGVALRGPEGWRVQQRTGGVAFRALWTSPSGSHLWLTGHAVPPGMMQWSRETADAWLRQLCTQQRLTVVAGSEVAWCEDGDTGGSWRMFDADAAAPSGGSAEAPIAGSAASGARHRVRVLLRKDLLVVASGCGLSAADDAAIVAALPTLQRR